MAVSKIDSMVWRSGRKNRARPRRFTVAGWAQQFDPGVGERGLELAAVVVLVRDHDLVGAPAQQGGIGGQHGEQDLAFIGLRTGQREPDREPVQGRDQCRRSPQK